MRQTSIDTYYQIRDEGLLSRMRFRVYGHLFHNGPMTSRELDHSMAAEGETRTSYHKRLSELERLKVVQTLGTRKCKITGRTSLLWDVTDQLPCNFKKRVKRPTAEQFHAGVTELQEINNFLKANGHGGLSQNMHNIGRWMDDQRR
jgi:hypothetical protein